MSGHTINTKRAKNADVIIKYLEQRVNCVNAMQYVDELIIDDSDDHLKIDKIDVLFEIYDYDENDDYYINWKSNLYERYDFMSMSNNLGFEYFPYIYGVLDCHQDIDSKIYIYYEYFEYTLDNMLLDLNHSSDWYDIVFQLSMITYYISVISSKKYTNAKISYHLCDRLDKPYNKEYELNDKKILINHKYIIVLNDFDLNDSPSILVHEKNKEKMHRVTESILSLDDIDSVPDIEPNTDTGFDHEFDTESNHESDTGFDTESDHESDTGFDTESDHESNNESNNETDTESDIESDIETDHESDSSSLKNLLKFINSQNTNIKIPPSARIISMITELSNNTKKIPQLLSKFYAN